MEESVADFERLEDLTRVVQSHYYRPVTRRELWAGAYRGMLESLDGRNRYLEERRHLLRQGADHVGFGFDWQWNPERSVVVVTRVLPGSPAEAAGLVPGDDLLRIDGIALGDLDRQARHETLATLPDRVGVVARHVDGERIEAVLERAALDDDGIGRSALLDRERGIGLVRVDRFLAPGDGAGAEGTAARFRSEVDRLSGNGLRALIIDLRGNPGGDLHEAVDVADAFLDAAPDGGTVIASQESRNPDHQAVFKAASGDTYPRWPLVVLIDDHTASSAELVAAALRDHRRALLVGETSAGKNTLQQTFALADGDAVVLTVAAFRTPGGRDLSGRGIVPDVRVVTPPSVALERARYRRGEHDSAPSDPAVERAQDILAGMLLHQAGFGF